MATEIITRTRCDVTGKIIPEGEGGRYHFGVGGKNFEIDLSGESAEEFEKALNYYMGHARVVKPPARTKVKPAKAESRDAVVPTMPAVAAMAQTPGYSRLQRPGIKAWAISQGYQIVGPGRVSHEVEHAYDVAHGRTA